MDVTNTIGLVPSIGMQAGNTTAAQPEAPPRSASSAPMPIVSAPVQMHLTFSELDVDKAADRFVGRVIDAGTGAVVAQVPSEGMLRLWERTREMIGALLDRQA